MRLGLGPREITGEVGLFVATRSWEGFNSFHSLGKNGSKLIGFKKRMVTGRKPFNNRQMSELCHVIAPVPDVAAARVEQCCFEESRVFNLWCCSAS